MNSSPLAAFPAARYRLEFRVETPINLPEYAGSTLRGAFGHALRRMACVTRLAACPPCPLYRSCAYPAIFETPPPEGMHTQQQFTQIPNPFVIEPPPWGERTYQVGDNLSFDLVLISPAVRQLSLMLLAWQRAGELGLGKMHGTMRLLRVLHLTSVGQTPVFEAKSGTLQPHMAQLPPPPLAVPSSCTLVLQTPLRLQHQGHPIRIEALTPQDLLMSLARRVALLSEFQLGQPLALDFPALKQAATTIIGSKQLHWRDWTRYSNRQRQEMVLGGAVGTWRLEGDLAPFMPLLHLGQWLHVGKNATFGLGHYTLG